MRDCVQSGDNDDTSVVVVVIAREKAVILDTGYLERLLIEMRVNVTTVCCTTRWCSVCVIERVESSRDRDGVLGMDACVALDGTSQEKHEQLITS